MRYAEVDQQGIVFNAHYLTYCDEAMTAYLQQRGLLEFGELVRLVTSTITWRDSARWGDRVAVDVRCAKVGRTSVTLEFAVTASSRPCCTVTTVYVYADDAGVPQPVPDSVGRRLLEDQAAEPEPTDEARFAPPAG